jgi:5-methylcytosine-specific restriction endonuclease McrA
MTLDSGTRKRRNALEAQERAIKAELAEIKRFEAEDRAADPKIVGTPGEGTERKFTQRQKLDAFVAQQGRCVACGGKFMLSEMELDHRVPLALGGPETAGNRELRCIPCHRTKTRADIARIAKAKRQSRLTQPREPSRNPLRSRNSFR